jgi:hypothetical protein
MAELCENIAERLVRKASGRRHYRRACAICVSLGAVLPTRKNKRGRFKSTPITSRTATIPPQSAGLCIWATDSRRIHAAGTVAGILSIPTALLLQLCIEQGVLGQAMSGIDLDMDMHCLSCRDNA